MDSIESKNKNKVLTFIDIGTNSIRLLIVRMNANASYRVLREDKEVVRLGENEYENGCYLKKEAMDRAVLVCKKFAEVAKTYGSSRIIAAATAATRDAGNQNEFLSRLHDEAGLQVKIIPGKEEARLIYLGVSSGAHIGDDTTVFIDLGGGSTEIAIGNQWGYKYLDSLKLGSIRLTSMFLKGKAEKPVDEETYEQMKLYCKNMMLRVLEEIKKYDIKYAYGSSGTIVNLAEIASKINRLRTHKRDLTLLHSDLKKVSRSLRALSIEDRKKFPGINPERADIIICGAVILDALMDGFKLEEIRPSERGLLQGMLIDELSTRKDSSKYYKISVRERSILQLGRSCNLKERHANTVAMISLQLFDSGRNIRLHNLEANDRELLKFAALLHDVGDFVSYTDHNIHSHYMIKNSELLGFDQKEINIIANVARYHNKKTPNKKEIEDRDMDEDAFRKIEILSGILRVAESLDRSHTSPVKKASFTCNDKDKKEVACTIWPEKDCQLEKWGIEANKSSFEKTFGKKLKLKIV